MNALRHDQTAMTPAEAEAIVARVVDRADPMAQGPSVADVAETLGISPDEVARLLAEHRARPAKRRRPSNRRERRVWMLSGVAALTIAGVVLGLMRGFHVGPWALPTETTSVTVAAEAMGSPAVNAATTPAAGVEPSVVAVAADHVFRVFIDGKDMGEGLEADPRGGEGTALPDALEEWIKENGNRLEQGTTGSWNANPEVGREAARAGRWEDIPGVRMATIELRRLDGSGRVMRWASATAPIYQGDDALVADAVAAERKRRVQRAVNAATKGLSGVAPTAKNSAAEATTGSTTG